MRGCRGWLKLNVDPQLLFMMHSIGGGWEFARGQVGLLGGLRIGVQVDGAGKLLRRMVAVFAIIEGTTLQSVHRSRSKSPKVIVC